VSNYNLNYRLIQIASQTDGIIEDLSDKMDEQRLQVKE